MEECWQQPWKGEEKEEKRMEMKSKVGHRKRTPETKG
jgi:hypothetical protein